MVGVQSPVAIQASLQPPEAVVRELGFVFGICKRLPLHSSPPDPSPTAIWLFETRIPVKGQRTGCPTTGGCPTTSHEYNLMEDFWHPAHTIRSSACAHWLREPSRGKDVIKCSVRKVERSCFAAPQQLS